MEQKDFTGKKILIGVPLLFDFSQLFEKQLEHLGFEVISISFFENKFQYKSVIEHLKSFYIKNFKRNKFYKDKLKYKRNEVVIKQKLEKHKSFDYAFFIRPEVYPEALLINIKKKTKGAFCAYQWDGLNRFSAIYKYISLFDRFFVFDSNDLSVQSTLPLTNFYFDSLKNLETPVQKKTNKLLYIGNYNKDRFKLLTDITSKLSKWDVNIEVNLVKSRGRQYSNEFIKTTKTCINFQNAIDQIANSDIVLDLAFKGHQGLSFRVFEAMEKDKKLITTNSKIVHYDFYHPSNIFIWQEKKVKQDDFFTFLNKPYQPIPPKIKEKYSFRNWIKYVLDYGQYQKLDLPKL